MRKSKVKQWAGSIALSSMLFMPMVNAEVIFEDLFDTIGVEAVGTKPVDGETWTIARKSRYGLPIVTQGDGLMMIQSSDGNYGGVSTTPIPDFDFFARELTFTFSGVAIRALPDSNIVSQWAYLGVNAQRTVGNPGTLYFRSFFRIGFSAAGRFALFASSTEVGRSLTSIIPKQVPTPYFNFDINELSAIKLTMDDINFRVQFVFSNPLDNLSFGGAHGLKRESWYVTGNFVDARTTLNVRLKNIADAEAAGEQVTAAMQTLLTSAQSNYDFYLAAEEATMGNTGVFGVVQSRDARNLFIEFGTENISAGAEMDLDSFTVETTNMLQVLR